MIFYYILEAFNNTFLDGDIVTGPPTCPIPFASCY